MDGARHAPQVNFRMPKELKEIVQQKAKENRRSMNSELLCIIEKGIEGLYGQQIEAGK